MKMFRLALLGSVVAGIGAMAAVDASAASDVKKSVKMYGHINRMTRIVNDGNSTEFDHLDNENSTSRFGVKATAKGANLTIKGRFEWQFACNENRAGTGQSVGRPGCGGTPGGTSGRISDVSFATKYGILTLGHGVSASDNMIKSDLSGTTLALQSGRALSSNVGFIGKKSPNTGLGYAAAGGLSGVRVSTIMPEIDGASRLNRIKYGTPKIMGFGGEIESATRGNTNYGVTYGGKLGGFKIKSKIAMENEKSTAAGYGWNAGGSVSVLHNSGVSATYSYAVQPNDQAGGTVVNGVTTGTHGAGARGHARRSVHYGKVGYQKSFTDLGKTYMGVDFERAFNGIDSGDRATKWGVGVVQKLSAYGTEVYAAYEHISAEMGDHTGISVNANGRTQQLYNINAGYFGARVKW